MGPLTVSHDPTALPAYVAATDTTGFAHASTDRFLVQVAASRAVAEVDDSLDNAVLVMESVHVALSLLVMTDLEVRTGRN